MLLRYEFLSTTFSLLTANINPLSLFNALLMTTMSNNRNKILFDLKPKCLNTKNDLNEINLFTALREGS